MEERVVWRALGMGGALSPTRRLIYRRPALRSPPFMPPILAAPKPKVGMISLGCAKNLVDAEIMLGGVVAQGMEITADADEADVLIVNTCAFIDSAKEESVEAILEAHAGRGLRKRPGQRLIVAGCMAQRFSAELAGEMRPSTTTRGSR